MSKLTLPKNTFYTRCAKQHEKEKVLFSEEFLNEYDNWIQQNDFNVGKLLKELQSLGYTPGNFRSTFGDELLKRKMWKRDGKYQCKCGFRTDSVSILANHKRACRKAQDYTNQLIEQYLSPEKIRENLDSGKFYVAKDYLDWIAKQENMTKSEKDSLYTQAYKLINEYYQKGLIKYSTDSERSRKAMGNRASRTLQHKYGVKNASQLDWVKEKKKETSRKNWGADHHLKSENGKKNYVKKLLEKYGVDNVSKLHNVKNKKVETFKKNWGVKNIFQRKDVMVQAYMKKLGVLNPVQKLEIKKRAMSGILKGGYLYKSKTENVVRDKLVEYLSNADLKILEAVTTNEKENQHYFEDQRIQTIYIPDIQLKLEDSRQILVNIHGSIHYHPENTNELKDCIRKIWLRDLGQAVYFLGLQDTYYFVLWLKDDKLCESEIQELSNNIYQSLNDHEYYLKYFKDNIWNLYPDIVQIQLITKIQKEENTCYQSALVI